MPVHSEETQAANMKEAEECPETVSLLTEIGAVVLNFLPGSKILNRPTVSTHYRIQKYVKKICLHKLIVEIALFVYIFVKFRNRIIRVKKI